MIELEFTGERVVPGKVEEGLYLEHSSRYRLAARFAGGRDVLDLGCGAGYGADLLCGAGARRVVGVDLSPVATFYARSHHEQEDWKLSFCATDGQRTCFPDASFDMVVAFELIEHVPSYIALLDEVRRLLRRGGLFLVSTPNKRTYRTEPDTPPNPFHVHEFEIQELDETLRSYFRGVTLLCQSRTEGVLFHRAVETNGGSGRPVSLTVDSSDSAGIVDDSAFLLALCSDEPSAVELDTAHFHVTDTNAVRKRDLRILELQSELEERTCWAQSLDEESSRRGHRLIELQDEVAQRDGRIRQLAEESESRLRRIRELEGELASSGVAVRRLDGLERRIEELAAQLAGDRERQYEADEIQRWHRDSLIRQQEELELHRRAIADEERARELRLRRLDRMEQELQELAGRTDRQQAELVAWNAQADAIQLSAQRASELVGLLWGSRSWRLYTGAKRLVEAFLPRRTDRRENGIPRSTASSGATGDPPRALVIDHRMPTPDSDAGSVRMIELLRLLQSLGFAVTFVPKNLYAMEPYGEQLRRLGIDLVTTPHVTSLSQYLAAEGPAFRLVLVSRFHIATGCIDSIRELCPGAKVVFDTVDLQYLRLARQAALEGSAARAAEAERAKVEELRMAARADATLVVSDAERDLLLREIPELNVHRVSLIESVRHEVPGYDDRDGFYFVGGFEHPPNVDAVLWFTKEVLPKIRGELPRATFYVLGSKTPEAVRALGRDDLVIRGHVPDMEPHLSGCRLSIAPLRYGAGIKGKVTQSLAWGVPCVMTPVAAEGIGLTHGIDALIATEPTEFARCVIEAYRDRELWERLSTAGRVRIQEQFSSEAARTALSELLAELDVEIGDAAHA